MPPRTSEHKMKSNSCIIAFYTSCLLYVSYAVNPACECVVYQSHGRSYGTFTSPNFPQIYPSNINCILYTFIAELDEIVELTFYEFDLQVPVTSKCTDFIRFFLDLERPEVNEHYVANYELCGNISMVQKKHYSSGRSLILELHTDSLQANNTGFRGRFTFLNKAELEIRGGNRRWGDQCAYDFSSSKNMTSGRLFSPKYPQNYPTNSNCQYVFTAMKNERVKVTFQNIQLEKVNGPCKNSHDYIMVRDGLETSSPVIAHYCNTLNGVQVVSSGENLYIQFVSNNRIQQQGFAATFQYIPADRLQTRTRKTGPTSTTPRSSVNVYNPRDGPIRLITTPPPPRNAFSECGHEFLSIPNKNGTFTSPQYPHAYPPNINCRYMFRGQSNERVQLIFTDLDLHYPQGDPQEPFDCNAVDSVTVLVNIGEERSNIGLFCGKKRPHMLMSNDNRMEVNFESRLSSPHHTSKGFKAEYRFVTDFGISAGRQDKEVDCGFNFKSAIATNGTFTSPNFPGLYPRNTECHYLFYGTDKEKIHITFLYFDVEGIQPMCVETTQSDYVEFSNFNIKLKDRKMYRFCGTEENQKKTVNSDGNFFRVTFKSNDIYDATGFEAFYQFMKQEDDPFSGNPARSSGTTKNSPALWSMCHVIISFAFAMMIS